MNIYCVVSIDTECDRGLKWRNILPIQYTSVTECIPNTLQKIFAKHGVKPTYLLSPEVLESKACVDTLKSLAHVELGSHLHCEGVEPFKKPLGEFEGQYQAMYSREIEEAKLANLTRLFEDKIGYKPTSFRAGRWGLSPHSFKILEDLGYLVDSSVTPYFTWAFPNYILDYKTAPDTPYFTSTHSISVPGNMRLLQVPVTLFSRYGSMLKRWDTHMPSVLKNMVLKAPLWRPLWFRPTYSGFSQMKHVIDAHMAAHSKEEHIVLNMMFHSVEILPNDNPYGFDHKRIEDFLNSMEQVFEYLRTRDVTFAGLSDIYPIFKQKRTM